MNKYNIIGRSVQLDGSLGLSYKPLQFPFVLPRHTLFQLCLLCGRPNEKKKTNNFKEFSPSLHFSHIKHSQNNASEIIKYDALQSRVLKIQPAVIIIIHLIDNTYLCRVLWREWENTQGFCQTRDLYSLIQIFVQAISSRWNNIRRLFTLVKIE